MSENITHIAICDDCFRLAGVSERVCPAFKTAIAAHHDFGRLGAITRHGDRFNATLLERFRDRWEQCTPADRLESKLAFVLGWLCHRAADRVMKPVFRRFRPGDLQSPTDCSVYHDAFVLKQVFGGGDDSYGPSLGHNTRELRRIARGLFQAALIEMHSFTPDSSCVEGWIEKLFSIYEGFRVNLDRYADAVFNPDPVKQRRYVEETRFYDSAEPLIAAARALQNGTALTPQKVREAATAPANSLYGTALALALGYLESASAFFTGSISRDALETSLDIGEPDIDGKPV